MNPFKAIMVVSFLFPRGALWNVGVLVHLLGITWIFGLLCAVDNEGAAFAFELIFAVLNSVQVRPDT